MIKKSIIPWNKGLKTSEETKQKISKSRKGKPSNRKGVKLSLETRKRLSESHKGQQAWNKGKKGFKHTEETKIKVSRGLKNAYKNGTKKPWNKGIHSSGGFKKGHVYGKRFQKGLIPWNKGTKMSKEHCKKLSKAHIGLQTGSKHPFWKGGITPLYNKIRNSPEYRQWRRGVFIRDSFTCAECNNVGGRLEAHHIKSFSKYPELRFATDNGITLCKDCHKLTDNYKRRNG
jgi:hypothetical protein